MTKIWTKVLFNIQDTYIFPPRWIECRHVLRSWSVNCPFVWDPKLYHSVDRCPPLLNSVLSHFSPARTFTYTSLSYNMDFNINLASSPGPWDVPVKIVFTVVGLDICLSGFQFPAVVTTMSKFTLWPHPLFFRHQILGAGAEGQLYKGYPPRGRSWPFFFRYIVWRPWWWNVLHPLLHGHPGFFSSHTIINLYMCGLHRFWLKVIYEKCWYFTR